MEIWQMSGKLVLSTSYHGRADAHEICQGVFNTALQDYILELLALG